MKVTKANKNVKIESFDSVREFTKIIASRQPNKAFSKRSLSSKEIGDTSWYGTNTFEDANNIMHSGYKEGCKDLLQCKEGIKVTNEAPKTRVIKNYAGFSPCVPAAIMNQPKTMYYRKRMVRKTPVINLYYDCGVSCGVSTDTMLLGGKNIYSLVKFLESRNIMVNLFIFAGVHISGEKHGFLTIKVKDSSMPINPQLISYPVIHPSFFRRHIFAWIETSECTNYDAVTHGYGVNSRYYEANMHKLLLDTKVLNEDSFYIDCEASARISSINDMLLRMGLKL